jgi:hypothetical protein
LCEKKGQPWLNPMMFCTVAKLRIVSFSFYATCVIMEIWFCWIIVSRFYTNCTYTYVFSVIEWKPIIWFTSTLLNFGTIVHCSYVFSPFLGYNSQHCNFLPWSHIQ